MLTSKLYKNKKFLIFDFDGTIADSSPIHKMAFDEIFKPFSVPIIYDEIAGKSTKNAIDFISKKNLLNLNLSEKTELISKKQLIVREAIYYKSELKPLPFVKEFIENVYLNYCMGIASSGSRITIEMSLKKLNLYDYFNIILCSEDVKKSKPSPEIFLKISKLKNIHKDQCLIFEDSLSGIKAAERAGIDFIDVNKHSFEEILEFFGNS